MFKKILFITTLCISLLALMGTSANAAPPWPLNWGWSYSSTDCYSLWKSVSTNLLDVDGYNFQIECVAEPVEVEVVCVNNGDQIGGSFRFYPDSGDLKTNDQVEYPDLLNGGKVFSTGEITDDMWYEELFCVGDYDENGDCEEYDFSKACHNLNNWYVLKPLETVDGVEGYVKVTRFQGRIRGYLTGWIDEGNVIAQVEGIYDLNEKEQYEIDEEYSYIWSLKKDGLPMDECSWCFDPIEIP